jgi:NADH pyrophosphatase NudC (nudix superfamily)
MPRLIDADMLEPSEVYMNYGFTRIVYMDDIDEMPTVDAEPVRHGHWINHFDDLFPEDSSVECSVCHEYEGIMANDNYCPNCGAKMQGDNDGNK